MLCGGQSSAEKGFSSESSTRWLSVYQAGVSIPGWGKLLKQQRLPLDVSRSVSALHTIHSPQTGGVFAKF